MARHALFHAEFAGLAVDVGLISLISEQSHLEYPHYSSGYVWRLCVVLDTREQYEKIRKQETGAA